MAFDDIPVELAAEVFKNLDYGVDSNSIARPSSVTLGTIERGLVHDCPVEVASRRPCLPVTTDEGRHFPPMEFQKRGLPHTHLILKIKRGSDFNVDNLICAEIPDMATTPPPLPPSGAIAQLYVALSRCTT
ncbi:uncharacterized protein MICPUCDRAFT_46535 [Micromonas pusilla CCMP1545]|jgi:hypothetical protein|uniref:Predicted protein n=1 Tax=Micromonas pusilla (strain CCMP1545) TaxID=564608 RepID=C1MKN7_MICPC|nr:uncharacterized protein MICPUCDRAFT_46535 [Micromonas pusilla CCMP1545]EEH59401.1 predicted protein [Micromonas pusilla CCMP1545]|mmetsp:Transcript_1533/g.5102  ORF Transcript_1533/g.5102 Transcript_1533/m.5102 type:complete len:131 (-) Transcript_1533:355-747(-)|eukprot:XP_003056025.1 predicted protein [Micromonas pusilla CCMP1545]